MMCQLEQATERLNWLNITSVCIWKGLEFELVNSAKQMAPFNAGRTIHFTKDLNIIKRSRKLEFTLCLFELRHQSSALHIPDSQASNLCGNLHHWLSDCHIFKLYHWSSWVSHLQKIMELFSLHNHVSLVYLVISVYIQ